MMKFSFTLEEMLEMPEEVRSYLESYISAKLKNNNIRSTLVEGHERVALSIKEGPLTKHKLLVRNKALYGRACSVNNCNAPDSDVSIYYNVPMRLNGSHRRIEDAILLCSKHIYKVQKVFIQCISVEAASNLIIGINQQGRNILKALVDGEYEGRVAVSKLLNSKKYNLNFKKHSELNGALSGINRRFSNLVERECKVNIYSTVNLSDGNRYIKIGKGVHYSIKSALNNWELADNIRVTQPYMSNKGVVRFSEKYGYYIVLPDMEDNITENFDFGNEIKTITSTQQL